MNTVKNTEATNDSNNPENTNTTNTKNNINTNNQPRTIYKPADKLIIKAKVYILEILEVIWIKLIKEEEWSSLSFNFKN